MPRQVENELLSAEEKEALIEELAQVFADAQMVETVTYNSTGTETWNTETGAVSEAAGVDVPNVPVMLVSLTREEEEKFKVEKNVSAWLIQSSSLSTVTPKLNDQITYGGDVKYILQIKNPIPKIFFRFITCDIGNA